MTTPEQRARQTIDALLTAAGWQVHDRAALNLSAARGVAVREFPLKTGFADYLLFVDRKAVGAVEAKPEGMPLSGIEAQSEKYSVGLPDIPPAWRKPLPVLYESTGGRRISPTCWTPTCAAGGYLRFTGRRRWRNGCVEALRAGAFS
jgi:type I restriction enzyme, R subunit